MKNRATSMKISDTNLSFDPWHAGRKRPGPDLFHAEGIPPGERDRSFRTIVLSIPPGKVMTYGKVAAAAGYPRYHRAVARLLRTDGPDQLPWHRVLGAGGAIKLSGSAAKEQRARLRIEGVQFRGKRVDLDKYEYIIRSGESS